MGHGHSDHLERNATGINEKNRTTWIKIDAQFCSLLWQSLDKINYFVLVLQNMLQSLD